MGDKKNKAGKQAVESVFMSFGMGIGTTRDAWVYNFSMDMLGQNMQSTIAFYNSEVQRYQDARKDRGKDRHLAVDEFVSNDPARISWSSSLKSYFGREIMGPKFR